MTNTVIPSPAAAEWLMFLVRKSPERFDDR